MEDKFDGRELEIFEFLRETSYSVFAALTTFELACKIEDIEEMMLRRHYKQCPNCSWWVESFELTPEDDDEPDGFCGNCRVQINE